MKAGESVLILKWWVGTAAIDLAKAEGAFVIAAASSEASSTWRVAKALIFN